VAQFREVQTDLEEAFLSITRTDAADQMAQKEREGVA
jgi:hypothetical protein